MAEREFLLAAPVKELKDTPNGFAPCYGRSRVFKIRDHLVQVEVGLRQVVSRALCVRRVYPACKVCPIRDFTVSIHVL